MLLLLSLLLGRWSPAYVPRLPCIQLKAAREVEGLHNPRRLSLVCVGSLHSSIAHLYLHTLVVYDLYVGDYAGQL